MIAHDKTAAPLGTTRPLAATSATSVAPSTMGGGDYGSAVQRLAPRESLPGVTVAGVTLTAQATGATFLQLEKALGETWARAARKAAAQGSDALLALLAPKLPAGADRLPAAHDIAAAYCGWARTQPEIKSTAPAGKSSGTKTEGGGQGADKTHNLDVGSYGLMVPLQAAIGTQLAGLCPVPGRSAKAKIKGACSVELLFLSLSLTLEAAATDDGFEVGGAAKIEIGIGNAEMGKAAISETLAVKGSGDDAIEAMHMAGLAIEHFLREQEFDWDHPSWDAVMSCGKKFLKNTAALGANVNGAVYAGTMALMGSKIADALWGKSYEKDVALQMDDNDYGEHSVGVGVGVGADNEGVELEVGFDWTHTTRVGAEGGEIVSEQDDHLEGSFSIGFEAGGWEISLSGKLGGKIGGACSAGFAVGFEKKDQQPGAESMISSLIGAKIRGFAQRVNKRAHPFLHRIADEIEVAMRTKEALDALAGAGGLELSGDYDSDSGVLTLELSVTHGIDDKVKGEVVDLDISFELGQRIFEIPIAIDPPR